MLKIFANLTSIYSYWLGTVASGAKDKYKTHSLLAYESLKAMC